MIILIDPVKERAKDLCDLLEYERIIPHDDLLAGLKKVGQLLSNNQEIDLLISYIKFIYVMEEKDIINKINQKFNLQKSIPILGIYSYDEEINSTSSLMFPLLKYDKNNENFYDEYLSLVGTLYPAARINKERAKERWLNKDKSSGDLLDIDAIFSNLLRETNKEETQTKPEVANYGVSSDNKLQPATESEKQPVAPSMSQEALNSIAQQPTYSQKTTGNSVSKIDKLLEETQQLKNTFSELEEKLKKLKEGLF